METTKVTVGLASAFNLLIINIQDKYREANDRKPTKEEIILNLCKIGLMNSCLAPETYTLFIEDSSFNQISFDGNSVSKYEKYLQKLPETDKTRTEQNTVENVTVTQKSKFIFERKDELESMYDMVKHRESDLGNKNSELYQSRDNLYLMQKQVISDMQKNQSALLEKSLLEARISEKNNEIKELKAELRNSEAENDKLKQQFSKYKDEIFEEKNEKKDSLTLWEKVVPYIPLIVTGIFLWFKSKSPADAEEFRKQADETMKQTKK